MKDTWIRILREHTSRYPLMEPQDYGKLIFQSEFGAEHMIADEESVRAFLLKEWEELSQGSSPKAVEDIGGALCRFPLSACTSVEAAELLVKLFLLTAQENHRMPEPNGLPKPNGLPEPNGLPKPNRLPKTSGLPNTLEEKIETSIQFGIHGMEEWAKVWVGQGCPAIHHSAVYRDAYHPHYRLLKKEYAGYFPALLKMTERGSAGERPAIIAIDGRCGSGKTSFAELVGRLFSCNVFHMDDYYLPLASRLENWKSHPAGNMDLERFHQDVLLPAKAGEQVVYCPYDCQMGQMKEKQLFKPSRLTVVEGSYSQHPLLAEYYDLKIFLTCSGKEQESRLRAREGSHFTAFKEQWIPMEENYFEHCAVETGSDIVVDTGSFFV